MKTVKPFTKRFEVDGRRVEAVVIEDRAYEDGELVETTLDYFAQADDGTVYYFGEDVKNVKDGKVVEQGGTWLYGRDTDVLGVAMPADPEVGGQYRFEDVPGVTMESNRVEETGLRAKVRGRIVTDVIRVQEFIQPEGEVEYKTYAPGIGVIAEYPPDARVGSRGLPLVSRRAGPDRRGRGQAGRASSAAGCRQHGLSADVATRARTRCGWPARPTYGGDRAGRDAARASTASRPAGACAPTASARRSSMLTARDAVDDRVAGLDSGADDYLVKPFAFERAARAAARARAPRRGERPPVLAVGRPAARPGRPRGRGAAARRSSSRRRSSRSSRR